ncbi:unnamed protein product [Sphagnum balticum]
MVKLELTTVGSTRRQVLELPSSQVQVSEVRRMVEKELGLPYERLKLVVGGKTLEDENKGKPVTVSFVDGDSMIAIVAPKAPPKHITTRNEDDEDDEDLRFKLHEAASPMQKYIATIMREKLKIPDLVLTVFFFLSLRAWLLIVIWFLLAPLAHQWDLGPVYIIVTAFSIIVFNLGKRQAGEASAYSIFNEGFRELPGTLNAERLDRDIRAGQF